MKFSCIFIILATCWTFQGSESRHFTPEELARELYAQGFPLKDLNDWHCLVMGESSGDSAAMNKKNKNGSWDWGLFQINDRWWCGDKGHNICKIKCEELVTDDITKASDCAKIIKKQQGFSAWVAWKNKCKGKDLPDVTQFVCNTRDL